MKKHRHCEVCNQRMRRHGKTGTGRERYLCLKCHRTTIIHRPDTHTRHDQDRFVTWLTGVENKKTIAQHYGVTRRTLSKEFRLFWRKNLERHPVQNFKAQMLIVDAKFIHGDDLCALIAVDEHDHVFWEFARDECYGTWYGFLVRFTPPQVVIADGHKGASLFVKRWWPKTAFQRCHFHMVSLGIHYLSRNPKEAAGQEILHLLYQLKEISTHEEKKRWCMLYEIWERQHLKVFNAKHESGGYVHRKLRSVRLIMRRALPDLFTYLDYPGCPNTTNLVEGWVNTAIAEGLRRHRGLRFAQKKTLVSVILSNLSRNSKEKNTRKFP